MLVWVRHVCGCAAYLLLGPCPRPLEPHLRSLDLAFVQILAWLVATGRYGLLHQDLVVL